jgi:hypothetical protein
MNLQEIIAEVNKNVDDELDNTEIIGWINRCIEDLTPIANLQSITTIPIYADVPQYDLPIDLVEVVQVVKDNQLLKQLPLSDLVNCGYKLYNNNTKLILQSLTFSDDENVESSVDVYYKSALPYLSDMEDIPQIPLFFHDLFVLFATAKFKFQDQDSEYLQLAANTYESRKRDFINYMNKTDVPSQVVDVWGMCW